MMQCVLKKETEKNYNDFRMLKCDSIFQHKRRKKKIFESNEENVLPSLLDLKKRKICRKENLSIASKVSPLFVYSYPDQIKLKNTYLKTCMRNLTKKIFENNFQYLFEEKKKFFLDEKRIEILKNWFFCCPLRRKWMAFPILPPIEAPPEARIGYRNKCEFTIGFNEKNEIEVGFVKVMQNFNPIVGCVYGSVHLSYAMQEFIHNFKKVVVNSNAPVYDRKSKTGCWRMLVLRESKARKELFCIIQTSKYELFLENDDKKMFIKKLMEELVFKKNSNEPRLYDNHRVSSLFIQMSQEVVDTFDSSYPLENIYGPGFMIQSVGNLDFKISPTSFFQINNKVCELLVGKVNDSISFVCRDEKKTEKNINFMNIEVGENENNSCGVNDKATSKSEICLIDLCCGVGIMGIYVAKNNENIKNLFGIELSEDAIENAIENSRRNGVQNAKFVSGRVEDKIFEILKEGVQFDEIVCIVDPPRGGLHPSVIKAIRDCDKITKLIYVSCNPESLMDNCITLCSSNSSLSEEANKIYLNCFIPKEVTLVDMFPHTYHSETVMVLERVSV